MGSSANWGPASKDMERAKLPKIFIVTFKMASWMQGAAEYILLWASFPCRPSNPLKAFKSHKAHVNSHRVVPRIRTMATASDWTTQVHLLHFRVRCDHTFHDIACWFYICSKISTACICWWSARCTEGIATSEYKKRGNIHNHTQDTRRFLHAVYRVGDLDGTLEYYKKNFGMKQIRYRDIPEVEASWKHSQLLSTCAMLVLDLYNALKSYYMTCISQFASIRRLMWSWHKYKRISTYLIMMVTPLWSGWWRVESIDVLNREKVDFLLYCAGEVHQCLLDWSWSVSCFHCMAVTMNICFCMLSACQRLVTCTVYEAS